MGQAIGSSNHTSNEPTRTANSRSLTNGATAPRPGRTQVKETGRGLALLDTGAHDRLVTTASSPRSWGLRH